MAANEKVISEYPDNKRGPLTFVLDVSGSMLSEKGRKESPVTFMNNIVRDFMLRCIRDNDIRGKCEISFILFADKILLTSGYQALERFDGKYFNKPDDDCGIYNIYEEQVDGVDRVVRIPEFLESRHDYGTNIGQAMLQAVMQTEERLEELNKAESYPAFIILITDGNPKTAEHKGYWNDQEAEDEAIKRLLQHTENVKEINVEKGTEEYKNNLIVPIVFSIGELGNGEDDPLKAYVKHFSAGYFNLKRDIDWDFLTDIIVRSVKNSTTVQNLAYLEKRVNRNRKAHDGGV